MDPKWLDDVGLISFVFADAQKFKVKFDECKDEVKNVQPKKGGWTCTLMYKTSLSLSLG